MNHTGRMNAVKLQLLQTPGQGRPWTSLDEWRRCLNCGRMIAGHQIRLDKDRMNLVRLRCPTPGCRATWAECALPEFVSSHEEAEWDEWVRLLHTLGEAGSVGRRTIRRLL